MKKQRKIPERQLAQWHADWLRVPPGLDNQFMKLQTLRLTVDDLLFNRVERYALHLDIAAVDRYAASVEDAANACAEGCFDDPGTPHIDYSDRVPIPGSEPFAIEVLRDTAKRMLDQVKPYRAIAEAARVKGLEP